MENGINYHTLKHRIHMIPKMVHSPRPNHESSQSNTGKKKSCSSVLGTSVAGLTPLGTSSDLEPSRRKTREDCQTSPEQIVTIERHPESCNRNWGKATGLEWP